LDNFGGAEVPDRAIEAYRTLEELLLSCGLDESKTSEGILRKIQFLFPVLLHGNAERNQFSNLLTKILPGRTQAKIKWSLPSKDCLIEH
jgi:hypothetical protein